MVQKQQNNLLVLSKPDNAISDRYWPIFFSRWRFQYFDIHFLAFLNRYCSFLQTDTIILVYCTALLID